MIDIFFSWIIHYYSFGVLNLRFTIRINRQIAKSKIPMTRGMMIVNRITINEETSVKAEGAI